MQQGMNKKRRERQICRRLIMIGMAVLLLFLAVTGIVLIRQTKKADQTNKHDDKTAVAQKTEGPIGQADNGADTETSTPAQEAETEEPAPVTDSPTETPSPQPVQTETLQTETPQTAGVTDPNDSGIRRAEEGEKQYVYLTFDDGPSDNTEQILAILRQYNIKATWFVVGKDDETSIARYKEIIAEGHTLGMHSYTHDYAQVYASAQAFEDDLVRIRTLLQEKAGYTSTIYRFPGGSSNTTKKRQVSMTELVPILEKYGIRYFDWNVDSTDGSGSNLPVATLIAGTNEYMGKYVYNMLLLHDAGDHDTTVEALPQIIQSCLDQGMEFLPITDDTPVIHHNLAW